MRPQPCHALAVNHTFAAFTHSLASFRIPAFAITPLSSSRVSFYTVLLPLLDVRCPRPCEPGEHVQSIRNVQLRNTRTGALQSMLAVGTATPGGEDTPCRGRVLLFEIVWQVADGGTR